MLLKKYANATFIGWFATSSWKVIDIVGRIIKWACAFDTNTKVPMIEWWPHDVLKTPTQFPQP
jgi:hypothetical protein